MAKIKSEKEYNVVMERIEELLHIVNNETSIDDKDSIELDLLSNLAEEYEDEHYPIGAPSLAEVIKLKRYPGVDYDENGQPVWYTTEDAFDRLGRNLIEHYGENFRTKLNQSRAERGMKPL